MQSEKLKLEYVDFEGNEAPRGLPRGIRRGAIVLRQGLHPVFSYSFTIFQFPPSPTVAT
jgi:hypothetical protein